ncbi:MlaA family lipoprotein [Rariglobus hedericola]|uniref:VacJ family lipoprotein n=1 Tax=Rariglobus hedericola TaxID=2597822 RepID=A0A556QRX8_9BACT|nr:VacJ family lipoprotein [Rariglobus hedericola]TSJ79395.1 VacJ family lipoprotein [Rariglobus hedericola]
MKSFIRPFIFTAGCLLAGAPALFAQETPAQPDPAVVDDMDDYTVVQVSDPFEPVNRAVFKFNDGLYDYVLRPVSKGYTKVVPTPVRSGIRNFFDNIRFPIRFVNSALQGKFKRAGLETGKFAVNTVAGLGGFIRISDDVPSLAQIPREDTGQTFGVWRIGKGPYLVLPVFGPGTARDTVGFVGDYFLNPINWNLRENVEGYTWEIQTGVQVVSGLNSLPDILNAYDAPRKDAIDPYIAVRSAYIQYREAAVKQ